VRIPVIKAGQNEFADIFWRLERDFKMTKAAVARSLRIERSYVTILINGKRTPHIRTLETMREFEMGRGEICKGGNYGKIGLGHGDLFFLLFLSLFLARDGGMRKNGVICERTAVFIRSLVDYLSHWLGPVLPPALLRILGIPSKRHSQRLIGFLNRQEVEAILAATGETWTGQRDHLLFLLLYNTGARISEILSLKVSNLAIAEQHIELLGKGRKHRRVPLWPQTQKRLRTWLKNNHFAPDAPLLPNRFGQRLTRAGAAYQLQKVINRASTEMPSLKTRHISPHSFRHSTAMALLEANVPTDVIALYLGHESPQTTHLYVEASLQLKKQALAKVEPPKTKRCRFRLAEADLLFLENL
jgi:integrase